MDSQETTTNNINEQAAPAIIVDDEGELVGIEEAQ